MSVATFNLAFQFMVHNLVSYTLPFVTAICNYCEWNAQHEVWTHLCPDLQSGRIEC